MTALLLSLAACGQRGPLLTAEGKVPPTSSTPASATTAGPPVAIP